MRLHNGEIFEFYVNEEKRTVVAVLSVPQNAMGNEMLRIMSKESNNHFGIEDCMIGKSMALAGRYEGKAVCHNEDEWDEEKGMQLAKLRALRLYMRDRQRIATLITNVFDGIVNRFEDAEDYCGYALDYLEEAIEHFDEE